MDDEMKKAQLRLIASIENEHTELTGKLSRGYAALSEMVKLWGVEHTPFHFLSKQLKFMEDYCEALEIRLEYYRNCYRKGSYETGILRNFGVTERGGE